MNISSTIIVLEELYKYKKIGIAIDKSKLIFNLSKKAHFLFLRSGSTFDDFFEALINKGYIQRVTNDAFSLTLAGINKLDKLKRKKWGKFRGH